MESGDVFGISGDVFLSNPLKVGQKLETKEISQLQSLDLKNRIRHQALNLLSFRQRSRAELFRRLNEKGHQIQDIEPILDDLESKGYLNDSEFAKMYAAHLIEKKLLGRVAVKSEFYPHQIPDHILDPILDELYERIPPINLVEKMVKKRMKTGEKSQKDKSRLVNQLKRRGFAWSEIEPALNSISWEE